MARLKSYREFWPFYVREHGRAATRRLHFVGTAAALVLAAAVLAGASPWLLAAIPVCGYGFAWASHAFVECNRPATFSYPLWSLVADFHMFALMLAGRMEAEAARHQPAPPGEP